MKLKALKWDQIELGHCFYVRLQSGFRYPRTLHRRLWEIWVAQQGMIQFEMPHGVVRVGAQQAVLIRPGTPHLTTVPDPKGCLGLDMHFRCDWNGLEPVAGQALHLTPQALHFVRDFMDCWGHDELAENRRRATWALVLMELARPSVDDVPEPQQIHSLSGGLGNELAQRIIQWMLADLSRELNVPQLARQAGYSPRRLLTLFHEQTGLSLREALARLRLEEAKRLLRHSPFQIKAIGQMVGYPNANKFSAFFHKRVGCTPSEYARAHLSPFTEITTRLASPIGNDEVRVADDD